MTISKVSAATLLASCSAISAFASMTKPELSSYCEPITIAPQAGQVEVYMNKDSALLDDKKVPFALTGVLKSANTDINVSDLKIEILKQNKIDSFQKASYGWSITTSEITVYGVKLRVSADYVIGYEIQGDVGMPVQSLELYAICFDRSTYVGQPRK
jgi:hypothetical protein